MRSLHEIAELVYGTAAVNGDGNTPFIITPNIEHPKDYAALREYIEHSRADDRGLQVHRFAWAAGTTSAPRCTSLEEVFTEGLGFDGSSIRAFQNIHESDMILMPDITTAVFDPVMQVPTLSVTCNILSPSTRKPYNKDARWVAMKAERFMMESGIARSQLLGAGGRVFRLRRRALRVPAPVAPTSRSKAIWPAGNRAADTIARKGPNLGYRPEPKMGYFRVPPVDAMQDWRSEAILRMMAVGMDVEVHHGEVASAGQQEIDLKYTTMVRAADQIQWYKYILKNVAVAYGKTVTFMPKPHVRRQRVRNAHAIRACGGTASTCSTMRAVTPA